MTRAGVDSGSMSRRAFSVCYMDARTAAANGEKYSTIFGIGALRVEDLQACPPPPKTS